MYKLRKWDKVDVTRSCEVERRRGEMVWVIASRVLSGSWELSRAFQAGDICLLMPRLPV